MIMNQQSASSSSGAMMQDVDVFREKLEVLSPEVLAKWLAENQEHPFAFVGLGVQQGQQQLRAAMQSEPTSTVLQDQLGGQGMTGLPMPMGEGMTPEMAAGMVGGVNTPQDMSRMVAMRPGIERGVSNLPVPNTMYGNNGGIVGFANGDLVEDPDYTPMVTEEELLAEAAARTPDMEEPTGPMLDSRWDSATDWAGDVASDAWEYAKENPYSTALAASMFIPGVGWVANAAIRGGVGLGRAALASARYRGAIPAVGNAAKKIVRPLVKSGGGTPLSRYSVLRPTAAIGVANLAAQGGGAAHEYLTDPREMPDHPVTAAAGGDPTPADLRKKEADAVAFLEAQKKAAAAKAAAADAAGDAAGDDPDPPKAPKKDGSISEKNMLLMELGLGMLGDTETKGGALGSLGRSGVSALKSSAVRKAAKADREFKTATLDLQKKSLAAETRKMDLVYDVAIRNSGMSQKELMTLRATFQDKEYPQILADARAKLTAMNDDTWFGIGKMSTSELNAEAKKLADAEAEKIFRMRQITSHIGASGVRGLTSLGGGVPSADGFAYEPIAG